MTHVIAFAHKLWFNQEHYKTQGDEMKLLIERLRLEHADILQCLDNARELKVTTSKGFAKLSESMGRLAAHIKNEDREFYPRLRSAAGDNIKLRNMLDLFEDEMRDTSVQIRSFMDKFAGEFSTEVCAKEFGALLEMLINRISKEENVLFPEIESLLADH